LRRFASKINVGGNLGTTGYWFYRQQVFQFEAFGQALDIDLEALPAQKYRPYNTQFPILSRFVIAFELSHSKRQA
jgi:hypothetical protein